ncbi:HPP family protein [Oxalobacter vibrioformis]|uniref:HPP family protein n=1 Tax=Oxalobacter vibrioformis TaxID=933080 RepID=A0A9E9LVI3_9BURK|nr:HPP family protein [Oxalobacter vibrioformis]WAW09619.1 HPP family protein [Oxalobacter vibrioformis]
MKRYFRKMRGTPGKYTRKPLSDIFWAWLGAFAGIYAIWQLNHLMGIQKNDNLFLIGSFGATAVLLYAAPEAPLSQPRNLIGGHVISAFTGVAAIMLFPENQPLAAALAVSVAIALMMATHTTHPPGGATALIAVIGGPSIRELGFGYALSPVLVGVLIMLAIALLVNNLSSAENRHYPRHWL